MKRRPKSGFTLLEMLVATSIFGVLAVVAFRVLISYQAKLVGQLNRVPSDQDLQLLLTSVEREIFRASGTWIGPGTGYDRYPPLQLDLAAVFPPPQAPVTGCTNEASATCRGVFILQDYPKYKIVPLASPRGVTFTTECYNAGAPVDFSPTMQPGLQPSPVPGSHTGLLCDETQGLLPRVVMRRWTSYPKISLPVIPVDVNQLATVTSIGPDETKFFPASASGALGMTLCVKFLNTCSAAPFQQELQMILEGSALYRSTGKKFEVVRKTLSIPLVSRPTNLQPTAVCPASGPQPPGC